MILEKIEGHVFSDDCRFFYRWGLPLCSTILAFFSVEFIKAAIIQPDNKIAHMIAAVIFFSVSVFLIVEKCIYSKIVRLYYLCENNTIINRCKLNEHTVSTKQAFFATEYPIAFSVKGTWYERFFLLSAYPFSNTIYEQTGFKLMKRLWKDEILILPVNEDTEMWIKKAGSNAQIPQYPKVAYFPQSIS